MLIDCYFKLIELPHSYAEYSEMLISITEDCLAQ